MSLVDRRKMPALAGWMRGLLAASVAGPPAPAPVGIGACRVAVVATPRSGNTWLRRLVAAVGGLAEVAGHTPAEVDWAGLPDRCALQLHWRRTGAFGSLLAEHGFRVVTLARHPLDVLISVLHFAPHEPETACWLGSEGGDESAILGATPRSAAFLEYATGPRARALLAVSREWWSAPGCLRVRYEDLVREPAAELGRAAIALGLDGRGSGLAGAVAANTLAVARASAPNQHFWQGRPGLWKLLLPAAEARRIAAAHAGSFATLGYADDPDDALDPAAADANWLAIRKAPR